MARNRSKRKGSNETRWSREAMGVLLAGIGILLLLSLVSYTPGDLPIKIPFTDWALLSGFALDLEANNPRENWIGPIGTLLGFIQIQIFGVAAFLLPLGMLWLGVGRLFMGAAYSLRTTIGFCVCLVSGASLVAIQESFFPSWKEAYLIAGPGGVVGEGLGVVVLKGMLSSAGSIILLGIVYWLSFFTLLGVHPVKFVKALALWSIEKFQQAREDWRRRVAQKERGTTGKAAGKKSSPSKGKSRKSKRRKTDEEEAGDRDH